MSWLFSRVLVEEYLGEGCSDGEPSVQLNGNLIQLAYLSQDKMTDFSRLSRFGMMFKPLTENRGEELLTLYLADFHAKTSVQPEKAQELTESDPGCGEKWRGSFTKYDLDSHLWKTHQCSLAGDLEPFLETWPQWGLMQGGECWEAKIAGQFIDETEFGLSLPTPGKNEFAGASKKRFINSPHFRGAKTVEALRTCESEPSYSHPLFLEKIMGWPTTWTELVPLEMGKSHSVPQQHGES
jgi:hypothetical protein